MRCRERDCGQTCRRPERQARNLEQQAEAEGPIENFVRKREVAGAERERGEKDGLREGRFAPSATFETQTFKMRTFAARTYRLAAEPRPISGLPIRPKKPTPRRAITQTIANAATIRSAAVARPSGNSLK